MGGIVSGVGKAVSSIFGGIDTPAPPPVEKPPVMPLPDDKQAQNARRRAIATRQNASGRASTIFNDDALGGS